MSVSYETRDGGAILAMNNPPVDGLHAATRRGLVESLGRAIDDVTIKAIMVTGGKLHPSHFSWHANPHADWFELA